MSIALACNVYNDAAALRGLLEVSARYFDNLFVINSGPGGARSTDGTIELCESFGATIVFDDMDKGFGVIRTRAIRDCGCEWAFLMDADERFFPQINMMDCEGTDRYPAVPNPNLVVKHSESIINQGQHLKQMIADPKVLAIRTRRRHWFDFTMKRACENWLLIKDHQLRIVRNVPDIGYKIGRPMHEHLVDYRTDVSPEYVDGDDYGGPFHDHFHMAFRTAYPGTKEHNEAQYAKLERGDKMALSDRQMAIQYYGGTVLPKLA